jgi:hypothetical protein
MIFITGSLYSFRVNNILLLLVTPDTKLNYEKLQNYKTRIVMLGDTQNRFL